MLSRMNGIRVFSPWFAVLKSILPRPAFPCSRASVFFSLILPLLLTLSKSVGFGSDTGRHVFPPACLLVRSSSGLSRKLPKYRPLRAVHKEVLFTPILQPSMQCTNFPYAGVATTVMGYLAIHSTGNATISSSATLKMHAPPLRCRRVCTHTHDVVPAEAAAGAAAAAAAASPTSTMVRGQGRRGASVPCAAGDTGTHPARPYQTDRWSGEANAVPWRPRRRWPGVFTSTTVSRPTGRQGGCTPPCAAAGTPAARKWPICTKPWGTCRATLRSVHVVRELVDSEHLLRTACFTRSHHGLSCCATPEECDAGSRFASD